MSGRGGGLARDGGRGQRGKKEGRTWFGCRVDRCAPSSVDCLAKRGGLKSRPYRNLKKEGEEKRTGLKTRHYARWSETKDPKKEGELKFRPYTERGKCGGHGLVAEWIVAR